MLLLVAVLACINVASATSVSKEIGRNSQISITRDTDSASQRFLRSEGTETPGEQINSMETRALAISAPGLGQVGKTSLASKFVQNFKLRIGNKSPDEAFKILELDRTGRNLFKSPRFTKWADFVTNANRNDPEVAMFATLATRYSDDAMVKMFAAAKEVDSTKAFATKLGGGGLSLPIGSMLKKSPDYVFKTLALDQMGAKGFASPQFSRWTDFITKANTKNPNVAIYTTLRAHYSDNAMAKMFAAAKEVDSTEVLATRLEGIQLSNWERAHKSVDEVFEALKLDKTRRKLFESPILSTWTTYVARIHPDNPNGVILAKLTAMYEETSTLPKMIEAVTQVSSTNKLANELRSVQFRNWLDRGKTPKDINAMLRVANTHRLTKKISSDYRHYYRDAKAVAASKADVQQDTVEIARLSRRNKKREAIEWATMAWKSLGHKVIKSGFTYKEKKDSNTQPETIVAEELERLEAIEETVTESDDVVTQLIDESTEENMTTKLSSGTPFSIVRVLAILAFLACINTASAATTSKGVNAQPRVLNFEQNDVSSQRFLRTEERKLEAPAKVVATAQEIPNDVFTKLKLQQTGPNLFESPGFSKWVAYVTKNSKESPDMAIFSTLAYHYSDDALAKMLLTAKQGESTNTLATKLEGMQLTNWVQTGKSQDYVFKTLALDQAGTKAFSNPQFARWTDFIAQTNTKNPEMAIFSTLGIHYSDDALVKMFAAAKEVDGTKALATKLEGMQLTNWVQTGKSQDYVFKTLALDQAGTKAFSNPQFARWTDFIARTNTKNPEMAIFSTLGIHYSDDALVKMFAAAKEVDGTKALATKLEGMQLTNWVHAEKSQDYVFKTLALDKMGAKGFENPLFARWTEFITKANTKDPDVAIYTTLGAHYSDEALAKMIAAATKVESTENLAANLRSLQFEKWVSQGKTPESVNTMLGVATNTDDLTKKVSRDYEKFYGKKPAIDRDAAGPSTLLSN
ncbi:hypothetical protein GQ600_17097 [Phytophthora cactorum]|nr:hypothetical protein GQ600_17097 [Phytophthora cactorum]